jgi:hypothetical protein
MSGITAPAEPTNFGFYVVIDANFIVALPFRTTENGGGEIAFVPTSRLAANQEGPTAKVLVIDHELSDDELDEVIESTALNARFKGQLQTTIKGAYNDLRSRGWLVDAAPRS